MWFYINWRERSLCPWCHFTPSFRPADLFWTDEIAEEVLTKKVEHLNRLHLQHRMCQKDEKAFSHTAATGVRYGNLWLAAAIYGTRTVCRSYQKYYAPSLGSVGNNSMTIILVLQKGRYWQAEVPPVIPVSSRCKQEEKLGLLYPKVSPFILPQTVNPGFGFLWPSCSDHLILPASFLTPAFSPPLESNGQGEQGPMLCPQSSSKGSKARSNSPHQGEGSVLLGH